MNFSDEAALDTKNAGRAVVQLCKASQARHGLAENDVDYLNSVLELHDFLPEYGLLVAVLGWASIDPDKPLDVNVLFAIHAVRHDFRGYLQRFFSIICCLQSSTLLRFATELCDKIHLLLEECNRVVKKTASGTE